MIMEKADKQQICSKLCSNLGTSLSIILFLVLFSFFFFFSIPISFPFLLTISIALLSTIFLVTLRKKKGSQDENLVQDKLQKEGPQPSLDVTQIEVYQQSETAERHEMQAEVHSEYSFPSGGESSNFSVMNRTFELNVQEHESQADYVTQIEVKQSETTAERHELQAEVQSDYSFPSDSESSNFSVMKKTFELNVQEHKSQADSQSDSSLPSESDSESSTGSIMGEIFEVDHNGNQNAGISDSFPSDNDDEEEEDSLIEINLPSSHSSGLTEEPKQKLGSKLPNFLPESIFRQQGLMELLAEINEMNEDENLIEIDISMGSHQ